MDDRPDDDFVIYRYTRKQAIEDGVLVDVTPTAKKADFRVPVALTRAVWDQVVVPSDVARSNGQSEAGRLWDVLWMCRHGIQKRPKTQEFLYQLIVAHDGVTGTEVTLKAHCGPGDSGEPVITIMLPDED